VSIYVSLSNDLHVLRHVRHRSIVLFHGAGINPLSTEIALVLEKVNGQQLSTFLSEHHNPVNIDVRLRITIDVCCALWYLHAQKPRIVYGDLKDSNVLIEHHTWDPHAKLLDFGLSRLITHDVQPLGGTLRWMAPEVIRNSDERPKARADIFSCGRFIYYVITGLLPLDGLTRQHMMTMALTGEIPPLNWPRTVPMYEKGMAVCRRCLVLEANRRAEIAQIHAELVRWREALNDQTRSTSHRAKATSSSSSEHRQPHAQFSHGPATFVSGNKLLAL